MRRSAVVPGGGARGAGEAALALGLPMVTTVNGKGVVDERHPLSLGASIRLRCVQRWLEAGRGDRGGDGARGVRPVGAGADAAQRDPGRHRPGPARQERGRGRAITGDARAVLERMRAGPARTTSTACATRSTRRRSRTARAWLPLMGALDDVLGEDGILAGDSTQAAYYGAVHFLPMDARRRFIYPTGLRDARLRAPGRDRRQARRSRPARDRADRRRRAACSRWPSSPRPPSSDPAPVVVPNNSGYGEIRDQMVDAGIEPVGVDLDAPDLPKLGRGVRRRRRPRRARRCARRGLREALERPGPTVIEVPDPGSARSMTGRLATPFEPVIDAVESTPRPSTGSARRSASRSAR